MKHDNGHESIVVPGSTKRSAIGGVEFRVSCCGKLEKSVHIQQAGKHTHDELLRIREDHLIAVAIEHANEESAAFFLAATEDGTKDCPGCQ